MILYWVLENTLFYTFFVLFKKLCFYVNQWQQRTLNVEQIICTCIQERTKKKVNLWMMLFYHHYSDSRFVTEFIRTSLPD